MIAAIRSRPEWAASERIPKLPVVMPTMIFSAVIATAANTEFAATERFSTRIDCELSSVLPAIGLSGTSALSRKSSNLLGTGVRFAQSAAGLTLIEKRPRQ